MNLATINAKLAWAVLITGLALTVLAGAFVLMTGTTSALLIAAFGAVAAQTGKVTLRPRPEQTVTVNERIQELVTA